ncbi:MAG: Mur ligase domain-containing protein [Lentisphaeria bacterium]|nr:Mur ligase domain-containing protein [Lentisphaeria bacterium]
MVIDYFFCGIGGSGMSALARVLVAKGFAVAGSDRSFDQGKNLHISEALKSLGIQLYPQDGSGINKTTQIVVVSSAVEPSIPDIGKAVKLEISIRKRSEILNEILNMHNNRICVGGTSGKSTVTAMIGWILFFNQKNPTILNGAGMTNFECSNAICGAQEWAIAEVDESDKSIIIYSPTVAVINNISLDHMPINELIEVFQEFADHSPHLIKNANCEFSAKIKSDKESVFDSKQIEIIQMNLGGSKFIYDGTLFHLCQPGLHNIENALTAVVAAQQAGLSTQQCASALAKYEGIARRFQFHLNTTSIKVIDDFAHNPDKIEALVKTMNLSKIPTTFIFQLHGFGPARTLKDEIIAVVAKNLRIKDHWIMPEIFYAGGTATKDISAKDYIDALQEKDIKTSFLETRDDILRYISENKKAEQNYVVLGARDPSLPAFADQIAQLVKQKS